MTTQYNEQTALERRIEILENSLVSHNATTERVLAACRRINAVWQAPAYLSQRDKELWADAYLAEQDRLMKERL